MLCHKHMCTLIGINQLRADLNSQFGGTTTTGGLAWRHNVACRLEFRMGKYIDENGNDLTRGCENPAGNIVQVTMTKNKTCPPTRRTGYYTLNYLKGIDYLHDLVDVAMKDEYHLVEKSGAWFAVIDPSTGEQITKVQGIAKVYDYLEENTDVLKRIEDFIEDKIHSNSLEWNDNND